MIITDLEGVAGVVSFTSQTYADAKYYEQAKILLTEEVNAAIEGLLEKGIEDILVEDMHGPGGICYENLHPQAKLLHGRPLPPADVLLEMHRQYDTCMIIGQHAMAGTKDGCLNHTQNSREIEYYKLNGKFIGEIAQFALYFGALDIPLIYVTGDEAACREAEELIPRITTVAVKKGLGRTCAISLSKEQARKKIRDGVIRAIDNHKTNTIKPLVWHGPFTLEKRFFTSQIADSNCVNGWQRVDSQTIRLNGSNILDLIYA